MRSNPAVEGRGRMGTESREAAGTTGAGEDQPNKVVVVTGTSGGIGSAVVEALDAAGYLVVATDREEPRASSVQVLTRRMRVDDENDVDSVFTFVDQVCSERGATLHGAVNVAGVLRSSRVLETPADDWNALFSVNAFGVFLVSKAALALMRRQLPGDPRNRRGIVTVASNSAVVPRASMAAYAASKAAAAHFTKSLGLEAAEFGVRCNVVAPGTTRTPMVTDGWADPSGEDDVIAGVPADFKTGIPLGRIADPSDLAGVVSFLLSESAQHMTMQELVVDGGAAQR